MPPSRSQSRGRPRTRTNTTSPRNVRVRLLGSTSASRGRASSGVRSMSIGSMSNRSASVRSLKKSATKKGGDHNDRATVSAYSSKVKSIPRTPLAKIYKESLDLPTGEIKIIRTAVIRQTVANTPGIVTKCDKGYFLEFFSPSRFKVMEAVMFNNMTPTAQILDAPTGVDFQVGTDKCLPAFQNLIVRDSYVTFRLKNVSQHKSIVELFIFHGLSSRDTVTIAPWDAYNGAILNEWRGITNAMMGYATMNTTMLDSPQFNKLFHTERVVFKMEPGEEAFYKKQGPKRYVMVGKDHVTVNTLAASATTTPVWLNTANKGNGCLAMFRVINDLTLVNATGGVTAYTTGCTGGVEHPKHRDPVQATAEVNNPFGGVCVEMVEVVKLGCPDKELNNVYTTPYRYISDQRISFTGTKLDIEVDADNSATVPSVPL